MNEIFNNIITRRSIRAFSDKKVERELLEQIIECARYAPSAMNNQDRQFYVIQNKEIIKEFACIIGNEFDRPQYNFYNPDALILVANKKTNSNATEDCACSLQNMFLVAHSLGIGTVWINQFKGNCDKPEFRSALNKINMPEDYAVYGVCALGYPADSGREPIKENSVFWIL